MTAPTLADAKRIVREIRARTRTNNSVRYYRCVHGGWHWTSWLEQPNQTKGNTNQNAEMDGAMFN